MDNNSMNFHNIIDGIVSIDHVFLRDSIVQGCMFGDVRSEVRL